MRRRITAVGSIWKNRGILWPFSLVSRAIMCTLRNNPGGLIVEPSQACTGKCAGCFSPAEPAELKSARLEAWLKSSPAEPVTIHFSGKHSDPLASSEIRILSETALKHCSMLSVSTIGLGFRSGVEQLPVDRWIFSIPAATAKSWKQLRGSDRLGEALENIRRVQLDSRAMVEVVLTVWKASADESEIFEQLAQKENWHHTKVVFGRFDPEGNHFGRLENIALDHKDCPYAMENNTLRLKQNPQGCPLPGYLFLDATGTLRPCPFTGDESPHMDRPEPDSWKSAQKWAEQKKQRSYPACKWCP